MKKIFLIAAMATMCMTVQGQETMVVTLNNGTTSEFCVKEVKDITFKVSQEIPTINGYPYVELAGRKWAMINVGAENPEGSGLYFWWGDTQGNAGDGTFEFNPSNTSILTFGKSLDDMRAAGYIDEGNNLTMEYDAARAQWGGTWRMPTRLEMTQLKNLCDWEWTENFKETGVCGYKVFDRNDHSKWIFMPAAGRCVNEKVLYAGEDGSYWTSTPKEEDFRSYYLGFSYDDWDVYGIYRCFGNTIRPVSE